MLRVRTELIVDVDRVLMNCVGSGHVKTITGKVLLDPRPRWRTRPRTRPYSSKSGRCRTLFLTQVDACAQT